jgi:DNA-directed RNA polymerase subunit RPC12/RpoP
MDLDFNTVFSQQPKPRLVEGRWVFVYPYLNCRHCRHLEDLVYGVCPECWEKLSVEKKQDIIQKYSGLVSN